MKKLILKLREYIIEFFPFILFLCAMLCVMVLFSGCRTTKRLTDETDTHEYEILYERINDYQHAIDSLYRVIERNDSVRDYREQRDSTYTSSSASDTLVVRDSTFVMMMPDGSTVTERYHYESRTRTLHDTLFNYIRQQTYLEEYHQQQQITLQYEQYTQYLQDSISSLRDSISNAVHNEVVEKKTPSIVNYFAIFGAVVLVIGIVVAVMKLR